MISKCSRVIHVPEPYQTLTMSGSQHYRSTFNSIYLQYYPSSICPSVTPISSTFSLSHLLFSEAPHPSFPTQTLSFSPPLLPLFLSIHTTESLLIICDLLKYIHSHSHLSLSLPGLLFSNLLALLIPPLILSPAAVSASFVFLFCRIICAPPPFVPQRSHKHAV